ncbi:HAMP domain-containing protein, partial [Mycobacterium tuberculosis]|nr:HAMP domain-containing protein [Mycobacterium tuberculosis]
MVTVASAMDLAEVGRPATTLRWTLASIAVAMAAAFSVVLIVMIRRIMAPLAGVAGLVRRMAEGDYTVEVPGTDRRD